MVVLMVAEVLKLKKKGMQLHDIAKELGCSISTVKRDLKISE
ncbi:MAG: hypothetical protein CXT78_15925 [Thaumarchaeota archaeon]|jgi:DNA-binding NarL/FixJ family response regulator|nr:MAG: hypothetical protein CXT78_15925 [Nitrososphaerota archaeon]